MARLNGLPFHKKDLRTGTQRRAFLTDAEHKHVFHFTPKHGSWLNQVELWFDTLARRFLKRGDFASAEDFTTRLMAYLNDHNTHRAHPYRWTYTGQPLVRATPFSQNTPSTAFRASLVWDSTAAVPSIHLSASPLQKTTVPPLLRDL
jgi:hypothetical protein